MVEEFSSRKLGGMQSEIMTDVLCIGTDGLPSLPFRNREDRVTFVWCNINIAE